MIKHISPCGVTQVIFSHKNKDLDSKVELKRLQAPHKGIGDKAVAETGYLQLKTLI